VTEASTHGAREAVTCKKIEGAMESLMSIRRMRVRNLLSWFERFVITG